MIILFIWGIVGLMHGMSIYGEIQSHYEANGLTGELIISALLLGPLATFVIVILILTKSGVKDD